MMCYVLARHYSFLLIYTFICLAFGANTIDDCNNIRDEFATAVSKFTLCSINNSRPITLCRMCNASYIDVVDTYRNMSETSYNGTTCLDHFVNLDRLQIVETQYLNSVNLWNRGKCYECYTVQNGTARETNETSTFLDYYKSLEHCIQNTNSTLICQNCMDNYVILHDYYLSISNSNERISFCIDLVDIMNTTWTYWSDNCCKYRKHHEYIFIGSTVAVILLTISFYIIVQFCADKRVPTIIQQSRFAGSVNNSRN